MTDLLPYRQEPAVPEGRRAEPVGEAITYLLTDRFDDDGPSVTVFSEPENGHYRQSVHAPFGKPVVLPEPIGLTLDTAEF